MIPLSCLEALKNMNLPTADKGAVNEGGEIKCSKMLSQLLSNQAESTANTMKILGSLLKDDGCSLNSGEQQAAAKLMGKMMAGGCCSQCNAAANGGSSSGNPLSSEGGKCGEEGYEKFITLGPHHCSSRRAHASKKKLLKCRTPKCELDDEEADVARTMKRVEDDNMTSRHKVSKRPKTKKASKKEKIRAVHPKFQHKLKKVNSTSNTTAKKVKKHKKKSRLPTQQNEKRTKLTHPDTDSTL